MPKRTTHLHLLRWSQQEQRYIITFGTLTLDSGIISVDQAWQKWLDMLTSFAFEGRAGVHCTIRKERLRRGDAYWYAYRSFQGHTKKRYLGRTAHLSLDRLEEISARLGAEDKQVPLRSLATQPALTSEYPARASVPFSFLETKLRPPRLQPLLVSRPHLLTLLDAGQRQKLTLVQAPAGYGKTTLIASWIARRQGYPAAWLSLDHGDNDPIRFWSSLITACRVFHPDLGQAAQEHLSLSAQMPFASSSLEAALTSWLNELARMKLSAVLILDDYHLIEKEAIHETLTFFIEHLPANMHVIILTRSEPPLPLVRWRASGNLQEVQSSFLRFSPEETRIFLQQVLPHALSEETIHALHAQLDGWAAGLRLFALSLQSQGTPQAATGTLAQLNSRFAANRPHRFIQEYFLSEVLAMQPAPLQLFLLQTSILNCLTGALCEAVTGMQDGAGLLEQAYRSGFFIEALEVPDLWYRHHPLFAEILREEAARRLGKEVLQHLSIVASYWYEAHAMPIEAIEAALSAQMFELAISLIVEMENEARFAEHYTMRGWLEQLPGPLLELHPRLCFRLAQALLFTEDRDGSPLNIESVEDLLLLAEKGWRLEEDWQHLGILYAFRATLTARQGLLAPAAAYAHQALTFLPLTSEQSVSSSLPSSIRQAEWIDWRLGCLMAIGVEAIHKGSFEQAYQIFLDAYTRSTASKNKVFVRPFRTKLADICVALGDLHQAASYYEQTLAETSNQDEKGEDIVHIDSLHGLARLAYEWNDLARAKQLLHAASTCRYRGHFLPLEEESRTKGELLSAQVLHAGGEVARALASLSTLFTRLQASAAPNVRQFIPDVLLLQAQFQLRDGDLLAATRTLNTLTATQELSVLQHQTLQLLQARLRLLQDGTQNIIPLLALLLTSARAARYLMRATEIQLLIALTYFACQQEQEAHQQLYEVLREARNAGYVRLFLSEGATFVALLRSLLPSITEQPVYTYARTILQQFLSSLPTQGKNLDGRASSLLSTLSLQEQRVLTLLIAGRSNPQIAQELVVSVNTIKAHVKNIYRKLGVANRMEASELARREKLR
ncbi:hypothetical protein EPA93_01640 [Ktedonosporobacter rubrisoli]|uniref:HTH luxR-type domain-containing protein n=1 Tax=Ktedonosporobacter rubrisoli TaxID=2509675 RepID=A0A4P6JIM2_KTERU|nr:LuxR C-terminal-related transcriptional regulator [Ktedonosporobacter rubrisoli]QBD74762.1 hypothetical protein EPA93_01640 [Ktedonosporobacter rubrisoli]